jgi:ATPase family protein associated with various cellular activities (AAA)/winged helix domain-containing protein
MTDWATWNQRKLAGEIAALRGRLDALADGRTPLPAASPADPSPDGSIAAFDVVARLFGLSSFERAIVLLCAAYELDGSFGAACAAAYGDGTLIAPTFGLALAALPGAHWSALAPNGPLRRVPLITLGPGPALTTGPLRIEERILHYLVGIDAVDERLTPFVDRLSERPLVGSHGSIASRIVSLWQSANSTPPVALLTGRDASDKRAIAAISASHTGAIAYGVRSAALPRDARDMDTIATLWAREAVLSRSVLLVECDGESPEHDAAARALVDRLTTPVIVSTSGRWHAGRRPSVTLDVGRPTPAEQRSLWRSALDGIGAVADVDRLVGQFDIGAETIEATCAAAATDDVTRNGELTRALWEACLCTVSPGLGDLAQRIVPRARWEDLVLPAAQRHLLEEIARQAENRWRVYEEWGFGLRDGRGRAITALFAGSSGTGKTMAAEILAGRLGVDCYRIDLSQVVSKYIGETEKNLRRVFDAAEDGGAVLLFDEADALFGKRSEVRDSHDRYANIEISFLLQRMESYRGVAILTTNMKEALDHAFMRRLAFILHFPFPDQQMRAEIWRRIFPPQTPTEGLNAGVLARMNVSGGTIRNIARTAAFGAAGVGSPVGMSHVIDAARMEFGKLERSFSELDLEVMA